MTDAHRTPSAPINQQPAPRHLMMDLIKHAKRSSNPVQLMFSFKTGQIPDAYAADVSLGDSAQNDPRIAQVGVFDCNVRIYKEQKLDRSSYYFTHLCISGHLDVACQRCLHTLKQRIEIDNTIECFLSKVAYERLAVEDEICDTILVNQEQTLMDLIEEEILLSLPAFPRHAKCVHQAVVMTVDSNLNNLLDDHHINVDVNDVDDSDDVDIDDAVAFNQQKDTIRPFANLAELMALRSKK